MTSKNLFFKLFKENLKRRLWIVSLVSLVMVLIMPIYCALRIESFGVVTDNKWLMNFVLGVMGPTNTPVVGLTSICAMVSGLSGFFYLHSRKQVDLYHSLPVRRETIFTINYINGVLIYIVPYIINVLLSYLVLRLHDLMSVEVFAASLAAFGINMLYYLLLYTVTIIAVMMTGNLIVSILGTGVFLLYGPMLIGLRGLYCTNFFKTYYAIDKSDSLYMLSSPLFSYIGTVTNYSTDGKFGFLIITSVIALLVLTVLAIFIYKKRPSEAAGKAMAFDLTKPVIKFLLVIPITLGGGAILRNMVSNNHDAWFIFGLIFTIIIVYAFIQIIYNFDIRSAFNQKKQFLVCAVLTIIIACVFRFDLLHYDSYIPKMQDVKSMSIYISGIDQQLQAYNIKNNRYMQLNEYHLDNMKMTNYKSAYELARLGIKSVGNIGPNSKNGISNEDYYNYTVKFTLKNNRNVYRQYYIATDKRRELLKDIYEDKAFKTYHFPLNQMETEVINHISINYASEILNYTATGSYGNGSIELDSKTDSENIAQFVKIYKEELNNLTLEEASENPIASVTFSATDTTNDTHDYTTMSTIYHQYMIYPSFVNTLSFIEKLGFHIDKKIDTHNITKISVVKYTKQSDAKNKNYVASEEKRVSYTDEKKINEIFPLLIDAQNYQNSPTLIKIDTSYYIEVEYKIQGGNVQTFSYYFALGKIPDLIKKDLELND